MPVKVIGLFNNPTPKPPKNLAIHLFQCRCHMKLKSIKQFLLRWIQWLKWGHAFDRHLWLKYEYLCERYRQKRGVISDSPFSKRQVEFYGTLGLGRELYSKIDETACLIAEIKCQGLPADIRIRDQHVYYGSSFYRLWKAIKL